MWRLFPKEQKTVTEVLEQAVKPEPIAPEPEEEIVPSEYGAQAHGLTQFGDLWLRLDRVESINFDPKDGCFAEVTMQRGNEWHLGESDGMALKEYMSGLGKVR